MRGKFGLPSGGKPGTANTKKEEEKAVADKQSPWLKIAMSSTLSSGVNSFSNIHNVMDGVHMNFGGITKKMSNISVHGLGDNDKRSKLMAEEKKREIDQVMAILEDVRLQCPQTHFGIILAYSGSTLAPIIDVGIRFKWFRMSSEGHFDELEESHKAWYPPTADDIGCMICAQCEDSYGQGLSRYVEVSATIT